MRVEEPVGRVQKHSRLAGIAITAMMVAVALALFAVGLRLMWAATHR